MSGIFLDAPPEGAPVVIFLVEQEGCPACEEYHPVFEQAARPFAQQGLPIVRINAASKDPKDQWFMSRHHVTGTPAVIAATWWRGPLGKIEGVATGRETQLLLERAWSYNRPMNGWRW